MAASNVWIKHPTSGEVFTFEEGMINETTDTFEFEVDQNKMPGAGPMNNQGFDGAGIGKSITIQGQLYDTNSSVTSINNIRSKKMMKYWLESLNPGFNAIPIEFSVPFAEKALFGSGTTPMTDEVSGVIVNIPAQFVNIKGRIVALSCTEVDGNPDMYTLSIGIWVCGF